MEVLKKQVLLEIKLFTRRKDDLFWTLAFPMFFMVLYGLVYGDQFWADYGVKAIDYVTSGLVVMALMVTGIMSTATGLVEDRERGIYRRFSLTPLKKHTIVGSQIIQRYMVMLIQTLLLLAVGILAFGVQIKGNYFFLWIIFTLGSLTFLSIGFFLASFIRSARAATPVCMIVFFMLLFLGGIFFPLSIMPNFLEVFSRILPSTHLNDALRLVMVEGEAIGTIWRELLVVGGWLAVTLGLSIKFFKWE
ncbi:MAG: ABC transporter permease [Actinomycetota bacterium]